MAEVFANNATLTALPPYGTTAPVSGTVEGWGIAPLSAAWPALSAGQTMSIVDPSMPSEIIRITSSTGPGAVSITVTRGADGTTPVSHQADAVFKASVVASALDSFGQGGGFAPLVSGVVPIVNLPVDPTMVSLTAALGGVAPSNGFGFNGDTITDSSTGAVWGYKASGVWPLLPINIPATAALSALYR